jgi:hypothetical protein
MTRFSLALIPLAAGALALGAIYSLTVAAAQAPAARSAQSSFYCDKDALTPAERTRHFDVLGPALVSKRQAVHELADGYEFQFPADKKTYQQLAEFIEAERLCCPFFDISLRVTPERGPLWVRFTGRPGTKQFIQADGADWIKPLA